MAAWTSESWPPSGAAESPGPPTPGIGPASDPGRGSKRRWGLTPRSLSAVGLPGTGRRARTFGALLVGAHDPNGRLVWLGNVGTGFTDAALEQLLDRFVALERSTSLFAGPIPRVYGRVALWVEPVLVAIVQYAELTTGGRLRKPSVKGLRADIPPATVTAPSAS